NSPSVTPGNTVETAESLLGLVGRGLASRPRAGAHWTPMSTDPKAGTPATTDGAAASQQTPQTAPLRVGVIGLGFAGQAALEGFVKIPNVEVIALSGLEKDRLAELGDKHDIPHRYERWEDL